MHDDVVRDLERARARTSYLTDLDDPTLLRQHDPLMSPLVWDLAHVGQQEELWLLRGGDPGRPGLLPPEVDSLYDAFKHRRADRPSLPLLPPVEARAYDHEVRGRVLDVIERTPARARLQISNPASLDRKKPGTWSDSTETCLPCNVRPCCPSPRSE